MKADPANIARLGFILRLPSALKFALLSCCMAQPAAAGDRLAPPEQEQEAVVLQLKWRHAFQFAGYYAAIEKGFYHDAGLDVTIVEHSGVISPLDVLLNGNAQYAVSSSEIVLRRAKGEPVLALAAIFQHSPYAFLVKLDSGIERVEDFKGLRVMQGGSDAEHAELQATLRRAGLNDGDYINLKASFDPFSLIRGETDVYNAYVTDQGFTLQKAGIETRYILPKHYGVDFYGDVLATTEREAAEHPRRVRGFLSASLKGWAYALNHPDEIIDLILEKYNTQGFSHEHLMYEARISRELIQPLLVTIGHMNPARWVHIKDIFEELDFIEPGSNIDGLIYQHEIETQSVTQWVIKHWISVALAFVLFLISTLLLVLFQSRRLVRQRTAQLSESERHWRELINAEPACVKTLDREGRLLTMNPAGLAMIQAGSLEQVLGHKIVGLIDDEYKQEFLALSERIFAGESGSLVFRLRGLEGREIWAESHAVPFRDSHGAITRLLSVTQDLTEQKAEEARNERLQRQLNQSHKMEALGQLSGGIAHDFNNMLGIINGYTSLVLDMGSSVSPKKLDLYLNNVLQAGDRAKELIAQLLAFSRVDSGDERSLDLGSLINEDVNMLRSLLPSSVEIELNIDERVPKVLIDPVQVYQILMNLCINARDAMDGSGHLTIKLGWSHDLSVECCDCHKYLTGDWVELSVTDTGCGMTEEMLSRIFEPFFTTKAVGDGTGMGLAVVHGIMSGKDRHMVVESAVGGGTVFKLFFPPAADEVVVQDSNDEVTPAPRRGRGQNILVVDDEPALAALVGDLLSTHEYQTTVINDSREALEIFLGDPGKYELLVTDQTMPGLTGLDLIKEVKSLRPDLPVILCSGFRASTDDAAIDDLVTDYIGKPYRLNTLLTSVNKLLA